MFVCFCFKEEEQKTGREVGGWRKNAQGQGREVGMARGFSHGVWDNCDAPGEIPQGGLCCH